MADAAHDLIPPEELATEMRKPNILFILSDDHAAHAISAYGSQINSTPHIDQIAADGVRLDHCYVTNSLCTPSRASILTGTYSHVNGVYTLETPLPPGQETFITSLRQAGYRTGIVGKWHLGHGDGHDPEGFDFWEVLIEQGEYYQPRLLSSSGIRTEDGYTTDILTQRAVDWLESVPGDQPWCLLLWHKAPHRPWIPDEAHAGMYADTQLPLPETFDDDLSTRATSVRQARMRILDLTPTDLKQEPPRDLSEEQRKRWNQQRWLEDYLACVASVDDSVGRMRSWLAEHDQADDTLVLYGSDQGFFLGDHGLFDKRLMYEASLTMPMLMSYPRAIPAGTVHSGMVTNVDLAPTLLSAVGLEAPDGMQGRSVWGELIGVEDPPPDQQFYYRYWEHDDSSHQAPAHYGLCTQRYKLIYYYNDGLGLPGSGPRRSSPEWELFDLHEDPDELRNVYHDPNYGDVVSELTVALWTEQHRLGDVPHPSQPVPHGAGLAFGA